LWTRRDEHDVIDATARWKNIGIIVACIAGVILLLWILSRVCGIRIFGVPRRDPAGSLEQGQQQQVNAARFMQYCVRRDRMMERRIERRELRAKEKEKNLLTAEEVDAIAPLRTHGLTMTAAGMGDIDDKETVVLQPPSPAVLPSEGYVEVDSPMKRMSVTVVEPPPHTLHTSDASQFECTECAVCLEGITEEDYVRTTRCRHNFHSHCLEKWLMRYKPRCPLCQTNLKPAPQESAS
jgi:hypothetical protein